MFLGLLSKIVPYGRMIGIGVGVLALAGFGLYIWHLRAANALLSARNAAQKQAITTLQETNKQNVSALVAIKAQYALAEGALQAEMTARANDNAAGVRARARVRSSHGSGDIAAPAIQAALGAIR